MSKNAVKDPAEKVREIRVVSDESTPALAENQEPQREPAPPNLGMPISVDEILAYFGAAKIENDKLRGEVIRLTNENQRLRATMRNMAEGR